MMKLSETKKRRRRQRQSKSTPHPPAFSASLWTVLRFGLCMLPCILRMSSVNGMVPSKGKAQAGINLPSEDNSAMATPPIRTRRKTLFPNSIPVQSSDVQVLQRQTGQVNPSRAAIGVPKVCQCQHGFPQAFAMDPVPPRSPSTKSKPRINSGLVKLTCPHLVRAIDALEDEGLIQTWNEEKFHDWSSDIQLAHEVHATARQALLLPKGDDRALIASKLGGDRGLQAFLSAGVAAASQISTDLKCLHAWYGDSLFRGPTPVADSIRQELLDRGIDPTGTPDCHYACDPTILFSSESDNLISDEIPPPPKPRNKQRLRTGKEIERRKRRRHETIEKSR